MSYPRETLRKRFEQQKIRLKDQQIILARTKGGIDEEQKKLDRLFELMDKYPEIVELFELIFEQQHSNS